MARKPRHTDAYCVLGSRYVPLVFRVVLEAEQQPRQHLLVIVRQFVWPDSFSRVARGGRHAAALHELVRRLDGYGDGPSRAVLRHVRLVDPRAGDVDAVGEVRLHFAAQRGGGTRLQAGVRHTVQLDILYAALGTQPALLVAAAVGVHHEHVRTHCIHRLHEVQHAAARVDEGIRHIADGLDHIQAFLFRIDRLAVLQLLDGLVRADTHIQVAVTRRLLEERHVPGMEHVVASRDEYFLVHEARLYLNAQCAMGRPKADLK